VSLRTGKEKILKFEDIIPISDQATVAMGLAQIAWLCHVHGILGVDTLVRQVRAEFPYDTDPDIRTFPST